jgi:hypothetical protein
VKVVTINGNGVNDYDVSVHAADCNDVAKSIKGHDHFLEEFETKRDLWLDYNSDFIEEGGAWPIHFYPCAAGMPDGGEYNIEGAIH